MGSSTRDLLDQNIKRKRPWTGTGVLIRLVLVAKLAPDATTGGKVLRESLRLLNHGLSLLLLMLLVSLELKRPLNTGGRWQLEWSLLEDATNLLFGV